MYLFNLFIIIFLIFLSKINGAKGIIEHNYDIIKLTNIYKDYSSHFLQWVMHPQYIRLYLKIGSYFILHEKVYFHFLVRIQELIGRFTDLGWDILTHDWVNTRFFSFFFVHSLHFSIRVSDIEVYTIFTFIVVLVK